MHKYHVTLVLQELATGQPVRIIPHLETTQGRVNALESPGHGIKTHFRLESESTAKIPHRAIAHVHDSPHRS